MAVYFPPMTEKFDDNWAAPAYYLGLLFCEGMWDEYLDWNCTQRTELTPATPGWMNSTAGPYAVAADYYLYPVGRSIVLLYRIGSEPWNEVAMEFFGMQVIGLVPGQPNGTVVEYYFLDPGTNITEPYEVKWGSGDYLSFIVNATCDIAITSVDIVGEDEPWAGDDLEFRVNCTNLGPSASEVKIRFMLISVTRNTIVLDDAANATLQPGGSASLAFNWTVDGGNWTAAVSVESSELLDENPGNQGMNLSFQVLGTLPDDPTFLEDYWPTLLGLAALWAFAVVAMMYVFRRGRRRRREGVARSIEGAREFLAAAEQFGADVSGADETLAKAEIALLKDRYAEAEALVSAARSVAMQAMGLRGNGPGGTGK
jgi:hypothetical protein